MKKTNRTDKELVGRFFSIALCIMFALSLILEVIGAIKISIIFAIICTILNILLWNKMFRGETRKIIWISSIMEIVLILPMLIVFFVKV